MAAATGRCACAWPRGFGQKVSAKSVLGVMRRMGLRCRIRAANPWRRYNSYGGGRDGRARAQPAQTRLRCRQAVRQARHRCHGVRGRRAKAYLAPVYDMAGKEIVAWDVRQHPDMDRQRRLLAMLAERLPGRGADTTLGHGMGSTGTDGGGRSSNG